jgi:hypothetical protein
VFDSEPQSETPKSPDANTGRARSLANLIRHPKGVCGNPRGRPKKDLDLAKLAQQHAPNAVLTLAEIMMNTDAPPSARVAAAGEILDRGFGRAPASLDVKHTMSLSDEFEQFIRQLSGAPKVIDAEEIDSNGSQEIAGQYSVSDQE